LSLLCEKQKEESNNQSKLRGIFVKEEKRGRDTGGIIAGWRDIRLP
jgi:hypothetical protein